MSRTEIKDPAEWRISASGYSIKTGWGDEKRIVALAPVDTHGNAERYQQWLEDAEHICDMHNAGTKP
jgi:hypothetical protein